MLYANGFFFVTSFSLNLSISSIDKVIGLKNRSSIPFLIFISLSLSSLSFNSLNSFSLEFCFFVYRLSISSAYVHFYSFDDSNNSSLYIVKKERLNIFEKKHIITFRKSVKKYYLQNNLSNFKLFQVIFK